MRVDLVTTWDQPCGIAEHSAYLKQAVEAADPAIRIVPCPEALDPNRVMAALGVFDDESEILHLNYHAALHSRWTVDEIRRVQSGHRKVVVTYHDTGVPNADQAKRICAAADVAIVHEPCEDLDGDVRYWRMGVPDWQTARAYEIDSWRARGQRPILGTIGFPFPWKNYDRLAQITAEIGWALLLIAPTATPEQEIRWHELNPYTLVIPDFVPRDDAITILAACDATAFAYTCANTGQSAAILQGVAARKPVHAFSSCRQFRALYADQRGRSAITWSETFEELADLLSHLTPITGRPFAPMVALAEQESWTRLGARYAALYHEVRSR